MDLVSHPVDPGRVTEDVTHELYRRIVTRRLAPGVRLKERQLAEELGVSRTAIRDALTRLEQRRLVERYPNRGAEVVRLGRQEILHIYELREVIEGLCVRLATERSAAGAWDDLVELFGEPAERAIHAGDFDIYSDYLDRLQVRTIEAASNPVLADVMNGLADRIAVLARRSILLPGRAHQGLKVHRAVVIAISRGNADEAERLKRQNLRDARDALLKFEEYVL